MLHLLLYALLAVVVAGVLFLLAARFLPAGEQIAPPLRDEPPWELPAERSLHAEDIDALRLPVALRGYRFAETDLLLDRLADELRARDREIEQLRGGAPSGMTIELRKRPPDATQEAPAPAPASEEPAERPADE